MKRTFTALLKKEFFSLAIQSANYLAAFIFVSASAIRYFFASSFFIEGQGTSDLRLYFTFLPYVSILVIPVISMSLWDHAENDEFLPVREGTHVLAKWLASFAAFALMLIPCIAVPIVVAGFGDVDASQVASSFLGILCYAAAALALGQFAALVTGNRAAAFALTALILAVSNSTHLAPLALGTEIPELLAALLRLFSFAWHFDAAGKGIIDSRDFVFYGVVTAFFLSAAAAFLDKKRRGETDKIGRLFHALTVTAAILAILVAGKYPLTLDVTRDKRFSVSPYTRNLVNSLDGQLKITYYLSSDLKNLYPQVRTIADFLQSYAATSKNTTLVIRDPQHALKTDAQNGMQIENALASLGIRARQMRIPKKNRIEFANIYSALVFEYEGKIEAIPFIWMPETLEYELDRRILNLASQAAGAPPDAVYVLAGNGLSPTENYSYALSWLENAGFRALPVSSDMLLMPDSPLFSTEGLKNPLFIFGADELNQAHAAAIERFALSGGSVLAAVSPNTVDFSALTVAPHGTKALLNVLTSWGIHVGDELALDISCFRMTLTSNDEATERQYLNYPLWIAFLPQFSPKFLGDSAAHSFADSFSGMAFWASPLTLYPASGAQIFPLLKTSTAAWLMKAETNSGLSNVSPFATNPFTLPRSGSESGTQGQYTIAAALDGRISAGRQTRVVVLGDQYFAADAMSNYTSDESGTNGYFFANLNFLADSALWLSREDDLLAIRSRAATTTTLYKKTGAELTVLQHPTIVLAGVVIPLCVPLAGIVVFLRRKRNR